MKIGLFFGSFNPIHSGHLIIANYFANYFVDHVWFIVSPQNPLKKSTLLLQAEHRLSLVKLSIETDERFKTSDVEFHLPKPSYTINTLQHFSKNFPENKFYVIVGSDNFLNIEKWKSATEILSNYDVLVYERPNFLVDKQNIPSSVQIVNAPLIDISSTLIRDLIMNNKSVRYLVPDIVDKTIKAKGYYK